MIVETYVCPVWRVSRPFVSPCVVLCGSSSFLSPLQTRSFSYSEPLQNCLILASQLRSCRHYESFLSFSRHFFAYFVPLFWVECTVSSSPIARLRLFAHIYAHSAVFAHISAHSPFERSSCTFFHNFVSFPSFQ